MHTTVQKVTDRIIERSKSHRQRYLQRVEEVKGDSAFRNKLPCSNLAHDLAGCVGTCRASLLDETIPNIGIISAYNDMVSAHQPYGEYPAIIKASVTKAGGNAQFAGGVPAMCDGVTQGEPGMDMSLMSRDVIAMSTVIGLSHNVFDGVILLGICDKILPGLLMGGLQFGHLPMILIPGGPMTSGIANNDKNKVRKAFAKGDIDHDELLASEIKAYHSPGTCTFYGTANSNQLMAEMLGMHLPGSSFVNAGTKLRGALTRSAAEQITSLTHLGSNYTPLAQVISEKAIVNAIIGLMATGGSTNETIHLVAIARAAGIRIDWNDFAELSDVTPLLVRIYPNGSGDINSFQQAGGMALLINELLKGGFIHEDLQTVAGKGFARYLEVPVLENDKVVWKSGPEQTGDQTIISTVTEPFETMGGIKVLSGNLGRAIMKISALADGEKTFVEAPAMVFNSQQELEKAFKADKLNRDMVAVVRFQGPRGNGMPELHKLITYLSITMDRGHTVGLVTDGRLSGASGKVPFAIHCTPEAVTGGLLAKVQDGDIICMDAHNSILQLKVSDQELEQRNPCQYDLDSSRYGLGRQIFAPLRKNLLGAEEGASSIFAYTDES
ncbi:phosphogluconate dehydratase [Desulfotalea psychrophila]|uniref:Phosphogluconate dehydratase n=1 Tax=Desulfotalea psychrophila TaxID=84980 RepID=A0ABS3AW53_9BACT|nr:phosphogluconate dehydratase [Desulfocapsa sp.]MBN4063899.1 phosphogluconate dehydratase [bacterium AH-315-I07]MBN4065030.1 phosphogluconate dehydratase [Desulfocapsa sp. AH-315-G09]MBN4068102.1 phosphogluconate dehydratase [Desulfotalea psychrophila]MBN4071637.1 phosphogluconate dehydratase [Desulfotalea psychrophila]